MSQDVAVFEKPRLPWHDAIEDKFGDMVDKSTWKSLVESVFPSAKSTDSVVMALGYCRARNLDPFKRMVHIIPMWNGQQKKMVEVVLPGIAEYRATAARTGQYAGCDAAEFGDDVHENLGNVTIAYPAWCSVTVYRIVHNTRVAFHGPKVYFLETYATRGRNEEAPNDRWARAPSQMLEKCAEAAALRRAFPEELGGEPTIEEMEGKTIDVTPPPDPGAPAEQPKRADYEEAEVVDVEIEVVVEEAEPKQELQSTGEQLDVYQYKIVSWDGKAYTTEDPEQFVKTMCDAFSTCSSFEQIEGVEESSGIDAQIEELTRIGREDLVEQLVDVKLDTQAKLADTQDPTPDPLDDLDGGNDEKSG